MSRIPCSVTDGPASTMDADEESHVPEEPEYDKDSDPHWGDKTGNDELRAELIRITRSQK